MNWDRIKGNWKQMRGRARQKLGKVTDNDTIVNAGRREQLAGKLQEEYGVAKEKVEETTSKFTDSL